MPFALVLRGLPPRLIPSPLRNCCPSPSVVWVACAVACSDWLAMATGSPGAPALIVGGRVGSQAPSSAWAGDASPISRLTAASTGQTTAVRRNPLESVNPWRIDPFNASVFDVTDHERRHATGANRRNPDLQADVGSLEHLALAQVDRHVLATAGAVEDDVAATHLRSRDLATQVVLGARVVRELDAHTGECVQHQTRTVEAGGTRTRPDALTRTGRGAATPRVRHTQLRQTAPDHILRGLPPINPRDLAIGETRWRGRQSELLQEAAAHVGGDLRRGRRDAENLVQDRDRVARDVGAGHHRQRGVPRAVPV